MISRLSLKGDLDKKTKGTPKSFKRSLNKNTAILENLPLLSEVNRAKIKKEKGRIGNK